MKILNTILFFLGIALFSLLLVRLDMKEVGERLSAVGWFFLGSCGFHFIALAASSAAWKNIIHQDNSTARFRDIFGALWFGHAINYITPTATLGEVFRGTVLKDKVKSEELVASIISFNFFNTVTMQLFALIGPILCLFILALPNGIVSSILIVASLSFIPTIAIFIFLRLGAISRLAKLIGKIPFIKKYEATVTSKAGDIDKAINKFTARPGDFWKAISWMFVARIVQPLEVWMLLSIFLPDIGWWDLLAISFLTQTFSQLQSWVINVVPGQMGFAEGGITLLFNMLKLEPLAGFAMELIRRLRMVVTVAIGLIIGFFLLRAQKNNASKESPVNDTENVVTDSVQES